MHPLLVIAADSFELEGLLHRLTLARPLDWALDFAVEARRGEEPWILAAGGPGPALARRTAQVALERGPVQRIVNTGFCGALDPALQVGQVVLGTEILLAENAGRFPLAAPARHPEATAGPLVSVDHVVQTARERAALRQTGALAVEMEGAALAEVARDRGLPLASVRVVSDGAAEDFAIDFNAARRPDGRFDRRRILRAALARPWRGVPQLIQLFRRGRRAADRLGEFLVHCQF